MLVWLAEHLVAFYSGFNVFSYLTFRAIVSLLTALFISLWMGPRLIAWTGPLISGWLIANFGGFSQAAVAIACIYFVGILAALFLPETRGKPLRE